LNGLSGDRLAAILEEMAVVAAAEIVADAYLVRKRRMNFAKPSGPLLSKMWVWFVINAPSYSRAALRRPQAQPSCDGVNVTVHGASGVRLTKAGLRVDFSELRLS
jgi:hypothetical protein